MKNLFLKRLLCIPLGIIAYVVTLYAQGNPEWVEYVYSQGIYPVLSSIVGFIPSLLGFSLAEWLVIAALLFVIGYFAYYIRKIISGKQLCVDEADINEAAGLAEAKQSALEPLNPPTPNRKKGRGYLAYRGLMGVLAMFCVLYFAFTALCGLNYYRYTFAEHAGYEVEESCLEELEQLCRSLGEDMSEIRGGLGEDADLSQSEDGDFAYYAQQSVSAMQALSEDYPMLKRPLYSAPKPVVMSKAMSYAGIGGVFFPFTLESNINKDTPFFTIPSTMSHELAHQCGFMREDEANFIAYLACKKSDEPLMRYSGLFSAFSQSISALRSADPDLAAEVIAELPQSVQSDIAQNRQFWIDHEGFITDISRSTNDAYLKANKQEDGVSSYGRMVDLLLAEQRASTGEAS